MLVQKLSVIKQLNLQINLECQVSEISEGGQGSLANQILVSLFIGVYSEHIGLRYNSSHFTRNLSELV